MVTWSLKEGSDLRLSLNCIADIYGTLSRYEAKYKRKYGFVPTFRIGLHGGAVVASEVGDEKREIVYFGDTINTAAGLASMCKNLGASILISKSLMAMLPKNEKFAQTDLGDMGIRGKTQSLALVKLDYIKEDNA